MKNIIPFSKYFVPAAILSTVLIVCGLIGFVYFSQTGAGGFNLGVDFQAGLIEEIQFAPRALGISYSGAGRAVISMSTTELEIVLSGSTIEEMTRTFPYTTYRTVGELAQAVQSQISGVQIAAGEDAVYGVSTDRLVQGAHGNSQLGSVPFVVYYLPVGATPVPIEQVRESLSSLGNVAVQVLGQPADRRFMIRVQASDMGGSNEETQQKIKASLENTFGTGEVAITSDRYVDSRFSKQLTDQVGVLMALTLLLILAYASFRFKPQFAIGAVLAIIHDALIMVTFIVWSRMEFNTTTIAALLTILGYSINDTIVIFDRIRETRRIYPDTPLVTVLNRSISETLGRTIITTVTTMLAVLSLLIFTTGSMKDFAAALLVGMISGVYSTIFIASGFVNFWNVQTKKNAKKKLIGTPVPAKA
jgi:preprotein translocase subunit SecF